MIGYRSFRFHFAKNKQLSYTIHHRSLQVLPTWFLNDGVAGGGNLLSLGFIGVLVIAEVAAKHTTIRFKIQPSLISCYSSILNIRSASPPHLSITARHSFLQVNLLPRRRRKPPGAGPNWGGAWCQSITSSRARGAARMARVAPDVKNTRQTFICISMSQFSEYLKSNNE